MTKSAINPILTLDYIINEHENKLFDRKSAKIKVADIAELISAFANAEGGTIVIGISDKQKELEGINAVGEDKINSFLNAPKDFCRPMPEYKEEYIDIINTSGQKDRLLLLHIFASSDRLIHTTNDSVYLRIGDKTREIKGDDLKNLEYSKGARHFEDELNYDIRVEDLDGDLLQQYKEILNDKNIDTSQLLKARGFMREYNGRTYLTNAAVLLFSKNILQFYPNCRIRFIRYEGSTAEVGTKMNIIKEFNVEEPILKIIDKAKKFINTQLRDFTALDPNTGRFRTVPEYPEFAWLEGIVNAVTHREYGLTGKHIRILMYDDRLEIESPGKLPNPVTLNNIKQMSFSRNPRIARVLSDFGIVKELNEGVKRIYNDMENFFLEDPEYTEPGQQAVKLTLRNNILMRRMRQKESAENRIGEEKWAQLDYTERAIISYLASIKEATNAKIVKIVRKSFRTVTSKLNHLIGLDIVNINGNKYDPSHTYSLKW